jgi:hypothetical protein
MRSIGSNVRIMGSTNHPVRLMASNKGGLKVRPFGR